MKTALIFLGSLAVILAIFTYFAVFGNPSGTYNVAAMGTSTELIATSTTFISSSTSSSTLSSPSSTQTFASSFSPAAVSWMAGQSTVSVTAAALIGNQLTFTFSVQIGSAPECVPLNLSLVADEEGDLQPPNPASFTFPDSGNCNGGANKLYTNATTTFTVDPSTFPLLFSAQDTAKTFFEVATTTANGIQISLPGNSG
jgi:hypothetical protein